MNIIIAGMGVVGRHLAKALTKERHNLTLLDAEVDALEAAGGEVDAMTIRGHAASKQTLLKAGVRECDLFMAVTNRDEVNFIAALRAKHLGAKKAIARATDPVYFDEERGLYENMFGVDQVINPKYLVAIEIHKLIRTQGAVAVEDFANNRIEVVQLPIDTATKATNRTVEEVRRSHLPPNILLVAILRHGELIIPGGSDTLLVGDEVICLGPVDEIPRVERLFGRERGRFTRRVIIVGGGDIGSALARYLIGDEASVSIIDTDRERCVELSEALHSRHVEIIHGDGTDAHLLQKLGIELCDVFVSASHEDEVNLMASLLAKEMGARRCISLVHRPDYTQVLRRLGLDTTLSPRRLVANEVLKHVRHGSVRSINPVMGGRAEFMEFHVSRGARVTRQSLRNLKWPRHALICAVFNQDEAFIPGGNTVIEEGQRVVVFSLPSVRRQVERYF